jgi:hypothetical protein
MTFSGASRFAQLSALAPRYGTLIPLPFQLARQVWSHKDLSKHVFRYFPRVSYCEFGRDFLGSDPGQMVQEARCTLGINMLNEKVN